MADFRYQTHVMLFLSFPFLIVANDMVVQKPLCHDYEKSVLLQFKQSFEINCSVGGSYPKVENWAKGSGDCCSWDGVECNQHTGHVTGLDLSKSCLHGTFPFSASLFNLRNLESLNLASNHFKYSEIPHALGQLDKLTLLNLSNSFFSGQIPSDISKLSSLSILDLSNNNGLFGNFNSTSVKFKILALNSCNLTKFPDVLRDQDELKYLSLSNNSIQGNIPQWLLNVARESLLFLDLSLNNLTGFEQQTCNASSLKVLDLSHNKMSGPIPHCLGNTLAQSLLVLNLRGNNFSGIIPHTSNMSCTMKMINLSENQLEGNLPRSLANCKMLEMFDISKNRINDTFPSWLGSLPHLQVLVLRQNKFRGIVAPPRNGFVFPSLQIIDLSSNFFSGEITFVYLQHWLMELSADEHHPKYTGFSNIPISVESFVGNAEYNYVLPLVFKGGEYELGKLVNSFTLMDFSSNKFTGKIPSSIGNLKALEYLNLSNNNLEGAIPPSIGNMGQLEQLDLSHNMLSGRIPENLTQLNFLEVFSVSHNNLVGSIPQRKQFSSFFNSSFEGNLGLCGRPLSNKCENADGVTEAKPPSSVVDDDAKQRNPVASSLAGLYSGCWVIQVALWLALFMENCI